MYGQLLGLKAKNPTTLIARVCQGLPFKTLGHLGKSIGMSEKELASKINLAQRTLARRKEEGKLSSVESQRLWRIAKLYERAAEVLGDMETVNLWFRSPVKGLGYKSPIEYIDTEPGANEVENMLGRIEDGVFY